jgi:hypothetical protein
VVSAPLEVHRKLSGRKLQTHLATLRGDLDYFVTARSLQIGGGTRSTEGRRRLPPQAVRPLKKQTTPTAERAGHH